MFLQTAWRGPRAWSCQPSPPKTVVRHLGLCYPRDVLALHVQEGHFQSQSCAALLRVCGHSFWSGSVSRHAMWAWSWSCYGGAAAPASPCSSASLGCKRLEVSFSVFKGEKVVFPTLPGSHLSFRCHNNLDMARVVVGLSEHAKSWRSGHVRKGQEFPLGFQKRLGPTLGSQNWSSWASPAMGTCVWCCSGVHMGFITAAPTEVGDAIPLPQGSAAMQITDGILQETFVCVAMFALRVMSIFATTPCIFKLGLNGIQCPQRSSFQIICHVRKWF